MLTASAQLTGTVQFAVPVSGFFTLHEPSDLLPPSSYERVVVTPEGLLRVVRIAMTRTPSKLFTIHLNPNVLRGLLMHHGTRRLNLHDSTIEPSPALPIRFCSVSCEDGDVWLFDLITEKEVRP